jgi:hypothetical protein
LQVQAGKHRQLRAMLVVQHEDLVEAAGPQAKRIGRRR